MNLSQDPPAAEIRNGESESERIPSEREYVHEKLGEKFRESLSEYDTQRRVEILIDEFLGQCDLKEKKVLDVGCGLGYFSRRLVERGADVTACDLGENLVEQTRTYAGCQGVVADALRLSEVFGTETFDVVVSSECIEHTPDPPAAVREMCRVLKPGGLISLSTPNLVWWPTVKLATLLRLRPFDGYENFSTFGSLTRSMTSNGVEVVQKRGLHLYPFQFGMHGFSRWCDRRLQVFRALMINLCVLGRKLES